MKPAIVLAALLGIIGFSSVASADPLACDVGDKQVGPNCVHVQSVAYYWGTTYGGMTFASMVYRPSGNTKTVVWSGRGVIRYADQEILGVQQLYFPKTGGSWQNTVMFRWDGSKYSG
jgi:hypothetical protein